jgi:hypothetical protein
MSGLTGHINHLYEDPNLRLSDIVKIYRSIAERRGDIEIFEKVDGYNIYISYSTKDKEAKLLRNNGQIKSGGISIKQLKEEFTSKKIESNKPAVPSNVVYAYVNLVQFFEKVIRSVFSSDEQIENIFGKDPNGNPQFFFNAEIIDPFAPNVIKYDRKMLLFHKLGNIKVDCNNGTIEATDTDEVKLRFDQLKQIFGKQSKESGIEITGDKTSEINTVDKKNLEKELAELYREFKRFDLDMEDTLGKYFIRGVEKYLASKKVEIDNFQREFVVKSILAVGFGPKFMKKPRANEFFAQTINPRMPELKNFTNEEPAKEIFRMLRAPIEKTLFNCSSILLDKYESVYITNNKQTADDIISLVNKSIQDININGSSDAKNKLKKNMDKLRSSVISFGELVNNPVEGIVFNYNNHTYKITSSFGPVNQIVHLSKYKIESLNESKSIEANGVKVLFAGAFKPPHKGHLEVIKNFIRLPELNRKNFTVEKVIVMMGINPRFSTDGKEFDYHQSHKLFQLYLKAAGLEDLVEIRVTKRENPVKDVYDYIANPNNDTDKARPGDVILLGATQKDRGYYSNLAKYVKDKPWEVLFGEHYEIPMAFKDQKKREQDILSEYSATQFRNAISKNDLEEVDSFLPDEIKSSPDLKQKAYNILGIQTKVEKLQESTIINIINNKLSTTVERTPKLDLGILINRVNSIYNK